MKKYTIFLDMDGVLVDLIAGLGYEPESTEVTPPEILQEFFYYNLPTMDGAVEAVEALLDMERVDLWIATKCPRGNNHASFEKLEWVKKYLPGLAGRVFTTPDKTKLNGDLLVDDQADRWENFPGATFKFDPKNPRRDWERVLDLVRKNLEVE